MRTAGWLVLAAAVAGCSGRCGTRREPPPVVTREAPATPTPTPTPDAAAVSAGERETACENRRADAAERQRSYCQTEQCMPDSPYEHEVADLDGDGVAEVVFDITVPSVVVQSHLYLGGARCTHLATLRGGGDIAKQPTTNEGYFDFELIDHAVCEGARCGCSPTITYFRHSNGAYREDVGRRVEGVVKPCPDE